VTSPPARTMLPSAPLNPAHKHCKKGIIKKMAWLVEFLNEEVKEALDDFPLDIRASFQRIVELIQSHGLDRVREPYVKHLEGPLWEMRMKGKSGIARAVYVTAVGRAVSQWV
jgi:phage-related protein